MPAMLEQMHFNGDVSGHQSSPQQEGIGNRNDIIVLGVDDEMWRRICRHILVW